MPTLHEKKDPPLEALVQRLNELTRELPRSNGLRPIAEAASPTVAGLGGQSQPMGPTERESLTDLMAALKRVEVAQTRGLTEFRREIVQAIGRIAPALERGATLSEDSIQKLRVALEPEARGNAERRILAELAEIKVSRGDCAAMPIKSRSRSWLVLAAFGLGIILFAAGLSTGVLMAPYLTSRLPAFLDGIF
jgi:hypothetical protein